ncbi:MAG TPA: hypothetical protein ENG03_03765 [Thioploca sp.]|nr:hypothetical protein [Thioploca sp.]
MAAIVLLALTLTLALLVWGSREGLLNRFMDVSLGYVQQAGLPIWVVAKVDEQGRVMDRELFQKIKDMDFDIHPYRLVEWDQVSLPNTMDGKTPLWKAEHLPFKGWAISAHDPLWKGSRNPSTDTPLPLEVVLSQSLFQQYFQCVDYEKALTDKLPHFQKSQSTSDKLYCLANKHKQLWLEVNTRRGRELMPFSIHWINGRIPTMEELAFLFPISTFSALKEAKYSPELKYYPEAQGGTVQRIKILIFWQNEEEQTLRNNLANCLLAKNVDNAPRNQIVPKYPLPLEWVQQCTKHYNIPLQTSPEQLLKEPYLSIAESVEGHRFRYDNDYLTMLCETHDASCQPCENIVPAWKRFAKKGYATCEDKEATADMLTMIGGYQQAFVYTARDTLFKRLEDIKAVARTPEALPALSFHPYYKNALTRFAFIDKVMNLLNSTYSGFFLIFLFFLLFVQIGIVIQHREHDYGIFLAKGITWGQLSWMVCMQIVWSFLLAIVVLTTAAVGIMRYILGYKLSSIATYYKDTIQVGDLELLPLLWGEYGMVSLAILGVALGIAIGFVVVKQRRFGQEVAHLF